MIAKDPEAHTGERIIVYGRVSQFDAVTGTGRFRADVDGISHSRAQWYVGTNTILTGDPTAVRDIVQGDLFRANVTVSGIYTYPSQGSHVTVPLLSIDSIQRTG